MRALVERRSVAFFGADRDAPLAYEPSGHDFLSPSLAEADLLRRILPRDTYREWLRGFPGNFELAPVTVADRRDGHLVHLGGLNLSRAWMLEGIASTGPSDRIAAMADSHRTAGLAALDDRPANKRRRERSDRRRLLDGRPVGLGRGRARRTAAAKRRTGYGALTYAGAHWIGTFAGYLVTGRGLPQPAPTITPPATR